MSDPRRWIDPRGGASDEVRALLSAGHAPPPALPPGVREAGARYVAALPKAAATGTLASVKALGLLGSVGAVVAMGVALSRPPKPAAMAHRPVAHVTRTPHVATAPTATAPAPVAPVAPIATAPAPPTVHTRSVTIGRPAVARAAYAPTRRVDAVAPARAVAAPTEEDQLREAHARLADAPARSLAITRALVAEPRSALAEEREYLNFRALEHLDRAEEARQAGAAFVARWPDSIYAGAVRSRLMAAP